MVEAFTIEKLAKLLKNEIAKGNGKKKILLSNDDEGNGYHEMFFGVTPIDNNMAEYLDSYMLPYGVNEETVAKEYVILG